MKITVFLRFAGLFLSLLLLFVVHSAGAQQSAAITATIEMKSRTAISAGKSARKQADLSEVVVWLIPMDRAVSAPKPPANHPQLTQHNKSFEPHLLVVLVGSTVDFPNRDPFFHNVFSLFDGKRFDLGLYEAGATNSVKFDRVGVSLLFCNIHPEMSAVVVALSSPYYAISDRAGRVSIPDVPNGKYELHVWYERSLPEELKTLTRSVMLSPSARDMGVLTIPQDSGFSLSHKNKYGQDYAPPPAQGYSKP
jgi:plastocyanin